MTLDEFREEAGDEFDGIDDEPDYYDRETGAYYPPDEDDEDSDEYP